MADEKVLKLIRRLHEKTSSGQIQWSKTLKDDVYQAAFPEYAVRVRPGSSGFQGPESYILELYDSGGSLIESVYDSDFGEKAPFAYKLLNETYTTARRQAMGLDKAIDAILEELGPGDDVDDTPF